MKIKKIILSLILVFTILIDSGCVQTTEEHMKSFKYIRVQGIYFETKDIVDYYQISSGRIRIIMKDGVEITETTCICINEILPQDKEDWNGF